MKKLIVLFLFVAIGSISCNRSIQDGKMPVTTDSESALIAYNKAIEAFKAAKFQIGRDLLIEAKANDPNFFMVNYRLALVSFYNGDQEKFNEYANVAIKSTADLSKAEKMLKGTLEKLMENQKADVTDIGKKLVQMYPNDVYAYYLLNFFQNVIDDGNGGVETLNKALEVAENPAPVYNSLGYLYMKLNQNDKAVVVFDKYIELEPDNPNVYDSKGDYFMNIKEYDKAYESFMKAYSIDSLWSYKKAQRAKQLSDSVQAHASVLLP